MKPSPLYKNIHTEGVILDSSNTATYKGVAFKTMLFLVANIVGALAAYFTLYNLIENNATPELGVYLAFMITASMASLIFGLIGRFAPRTAKVVGFIYSLSIGFLLGSITSIVDHYIIRYAGVICVLGTLIIYGVVLLLFATGVIKNSNIFRSILFGVLIGGLLLAIFTMVFGFIMRAENLKGNLGWGISAYLGLCIALESFLLLYGVITLTLNFSEAQAVVQQGAPKDSEWSVALGMEISLVYIYVELLRLLVLIASLVDRK